ncbi:MAG: tetratricopeptide repeat protein [Ignavibacteriae bacterium]|nr:tetratricopeptide repeat protein [Ignavibacteriota bacterium]
MKTVWIYIFGFTFLFFTAHAQQKNIEVKLKLAQSYERSGDFEAAVRLYEEAYAKDSTNPTLFESLKRCYLQTKKYPEAITIINRRLYQTPNDLSLLCQLGTIHVRNAEDAKGFTVWERAILLDSTNEVTYSIVANSMMEVRLFEKAIETYKRGRRACNKDKLYITDLAYLYGSTLNYADATSEYLKLIQENPAQLGFVQSRMASYTNRADGRKAATESVEQITKTETENLAMSQLLAWLYMEGKQYDKAFDVYKLIDKKTNAGGREIFTFAERAFRDKSYMIASQAYQEVVSTFPKFLMVPQAKFGHARTLEELSATNDTLKLFGNVSPFQSEEKPATESEPQFTGVVLAYKRIVSEYPKTEIAARSLLRVASLMFERFFNLDEAQSTLNDFLKNYGQFIPLAVEAKLLLGDVTLAQGNLDKAEETLKSISDIRPVSPENKDKTNLRLAEIAYFRGQFKSAIEQLGTVMNDALSNTTNDALTLQIFMQENQEKNSAALREFAKADFLKRQRKLSEALAIYENIFKSDTESEMADEALMSIGDMYAQMRRFPEAVASYEQLATDYEESINLDKATMKTGQIYELGLKDKNKAIEAYQKLLEKFPNSILVSEARKRIRELRGDNI